jgi:hypothetical protein
MHGWISAWLADGSFCFLGSERHEHAFDKLFTRKNQALELQRNASDES